MLIYRHTCNVPNNIYIHAYNIFIIFAIYRKILYPSSFSLQKLYSSDFDIIHAVHQSYFVIVTDQSVKLDSISIVCKKSNALFLDNGGNYDFLSDILWVFFAAADDATKDSLSNITMIN